MTPEERFMKMENLLNAMVERQAEHEERMRQQDQRMGKFDERMDRLEKESEKNAAAIRDLIVVSRAVLTSIQELREEDRRLKERIDQLRDAQAVTEEKLHALIETVDRIIRNRERNEGKN
jgi:uncharacterized coiled-coil DUF342 family protein